MKIKYIINVIIIISIIFGAEQTMDGQDLGRLGDYSSPTLPANDRAMGFLIKGKVRSTVLNFGNFIDIDYDRRGAWDSYPVGLWGEYAYLPQVGFMAGVPGMYYSYKFNSDPTQETWIEVHDFAYNGEEVVVFENSDAYNYWFTGKKDGSVGKCASDFEKIRFAGIIFENIDDDDGIIGTLLNEDFNDCGIDGLCSAEYDEDGNVVQAYDGADAGESNCFFDDFETLINDNGDGFLTFGDDMFLLFSEPNQWAMDHEQERILISVVRGVNPNNSSAYNSIDAEADNKKSIGLIYPWALRPALQKRDSGKDYDNYDYTDCGNDWSDCSNLDYYGTTVSESWFDRGWDIDWQPTPKSRENTHNTKVTTGDVFGDTPYTDPDDTYPILAHSNYSDTWPTKVDILTGEDVPFWPGWYADTYDVTLPGCTGDKQDERCWESDSTRFVSDSDVYMEFDDRWAHLGNDVNTNNEYKTKGYPLGIKVKATAHSYGVSFAEDIMFVTIKLRNESGDYCAFSKNQSGEKVPTLDEYGNQICGEGMVLPDGSKINEGKGYDYEGTSLGFYFDADAATQDINGNTSVHSNADDFMEYLDTLVVVNDQELIISMAMIYDLDGVSSGETGLGIVGVQLLDSPYATQVLTEEEHGIDRIPGQKLKMTDWHWFDWFTRPGVRSAGASSTPADDKESIMYKIMVGDTTNLKTNQKAWHFHTDNPVTDKDEDLNIHFDSLIGLPLEEVFDGGLDCVLIMSCGPFDLEVGEEVPFSFTIIFGEDQADLRRNATFAQVMYNSHYQGFTAPNIPEVSSNSDHEEITLYWDSKAETSTDVVTEYSDFEGYRIYKSKDAGLTWGDPINKIFDNNGTLVGWRPIAQFDLSAAADSSFCLKDASGDSETCVGGTRNMEISGPDPLAPWIDLGDNIWIEEGDIVDGLYSYIDRGNCKDHRYADSTACVLNNSIWEKVLDGVEYTYSITAYDMGIPADYSINWEFVDSVYTDTTAYALFEPDTLFNESNPDHWSSPYGYPSIESPKGTTIKDINYITVKAGYDVDSDDHVISPTVVPNPYFVHSNFNENEWVREIHFTRLPKEKTSIKIFTISGERVNTLSSEDNDGYVGVIEWNIRSMNNQEIAPGLYIYVVESSGYEHIGKFAVVR